MHKQFYFLSPVEVVKVTSQNLEEAAAWCGGSVQETESRKVKGRMDKYVLAPVPDGKNISSAFPGMFITKRLVLNIKGELRATYAVFRRDYFEKNYFDTPKEATDKTWERAESEKAKKPTNREVHVTVNVGDALLAAQAAQVEAKESAVKSENLSNMLFESEKPIIPDYLGASVRFVPPLETDLVHNHKLGETCVESGCTTERYVDGTHVFADEVVYATPEGWRVGSIHAELQTPAKSYLEQLVSTPQED